MNQKLIVIDGKTYKSVDEMPEDIRKQYEDAMRRLDKNQNSTPDVFEGLASLQGSPANVMSSTKFVVNGQTIDSLDQLSPELRAKYEEAWNSMDANRNGIPDFIEGMINMPNQNPNTAAVSSGQQVRGLSAQR